MTLLKRGSKGDDVAKVQRFLGIEADGIFGVKTEVAVKEWQHSRGLVADGIVGEKTWGAMFPASTSKAVDPAVVYAPLKCCITRTPNRVIKYIAIHYTAGGSSAAGRAVAMKNSWEKTKRASADFGVDDRDMVQFNPDPRNYRCWSVGDKKNPYSNGGQLYGKATNSNTISIEICSNLKAGYTAKAANHEGWYYTDAALANAVRLTKILMAKYNVPIERVIRHWDVSGKCCPGVPGWTKSQLYDAHGNKTGKYSDESEWIKFKNRLL